MAETPHWRDALPPAEPAGRRRLRRGLIAVGVVALLAAVGASLALLVRSPESAVRAYATAIAEGDFAAAAAHGPTLPADSLAAAARPAAPLSIEQIELVDRDGDRATARLTYTNGGGVESTSLQLERTARHWIEPVAWHVVTPLTGRLALEGQDLPLAHVAGVEVQLDTAADGRSSAVVELYPGLYEVGIVADGFDTGTWSVPVGGPALTQPLTGTMLPEARAAVGAAVDAFVATCIDGSATDPDTCPEAVTSELGEAVVWDPEAWASTALRPDGTFVSFVEIGYLPAEDADPRVARFQLEGDFTLDGDTATIEVDP